MGETIGPDTRFTCTRLACRGVSVRTCVLRQVTSDHQRTNDLERGQSPSYPNCQTHLCDQGRAYRLALEAAGVDVHYRPGLGATGRGEHGRTRSGEAYRAALRRLAAVGLLDPPPTMDEPPREEDDVAA